MTKFTFFCVFHFDGIQVYDVTKFLDDHPGGDEVILTSTGKHKESLNYRFFLVCYFHILNKNVLVFRERRNR